MSTPSACVGLVRVPAKDTVTLVSLEGGKGATLVQVRRPCSGVLCAQGADDVMAVELPSSAGVELRWPGQPGRIHPASMEAVSIGPDHILVGTTPLWLRHVDVSRVRPALLGPGESAAGIVQTQHTMAWRVATGTKPNKVLQRLDWLEPPSDLLAQGMPADAYPILDRQGVLRAWAIQRAPRLWNITVVGRAVPIQIQTPRAHPPVRFAGSGAMEIVEGATVIPLGPGVDAGVQPILRATEVGTRPVFVLPNGRVEIEEHGRRRVLRDPAAGQDAAGGALPRGATRERLLAYGGNGSELLLVERIRRQDCKVDDRVHLLNVDSGTVITLARGDKVRMQALYALGTFHWLEAEPAYKDMRDTKDDGRATIEFK